MRFTETALPGAFVIEAERMADERGFFARSYCAREFGEHGLHTDWPQCNISFNRSTGTLRGMHWQAAPHEEVKLVRCTTGAIHDVIVDVRPHSPTFKEHFGITLSADNHTMLYIPGGFAHGFLTLEDNTEVFYQMGATYAPESARGARWNDPAFGIEWPSDIQVISERDGVYPDFQE